MESLWSFFNGVPSNRKLAEDKAVTVNKQVKELEKMQKPIEELKKYIDDYEFFDSVYVINDDIFGL
jgi:cell division protein FtsB